jgi:tetratricopeptide (TPR) repeat protein
MKSATSSHFWTRPACSLAAEPAATRGLPPSAPLPSARGPFIEVRSHRRLRGPYTAAGAVLRHAVPELLAIDRELVAARAAEIVTMAPELTPVIPAAPQTLTNCASTEERTRFYPAVRTLRLSHGAAELLMDWARLAHAGGVVLSFLDLDDADPSDREFVSVLLRRCDPDLITVVAESASAQSASLDSASAGGPLGEALARYAIQACRPPRSEPVRPAGTDLAQAFIDSDGTHWDPAARAAYAALPAGERASRHDARAAILAALGEPGHRLGAIPYHREHGTDPAGAGVAALAAACEECFGLGCYDAALELAIRGRELAAADQQPYWTFTYKAGACLSTLRRGTYGLDYFDELRRVTANPDTHMVACYATAMLYTRYLPAGNHDEYRALEWVNTAIALADRHPDPHKRVFFGAFMRNGRALVELHRADPRTAIALVNEAIAMTDADLGTDEQLLHRSVLLFNRAQVLNVLADYAGSLRDYDVVISRDPEYGEYYFERAGVYRSAGRYDEALADYATAIALSPPFHEAHYNRADLLREMGDADGALRDLDYAVVLDPAHVDSRVNRVDLLLERGDTERARADIDAGLALDPDNANLLSARGALLAESDDADAAHASYTAALTADPAFAAAWANRGVLSYSAGRTSDAVADLDQAIGLADDPWLRLNRAVALQDLGEHQRAVADLDVAVAALGDGDPDLFYRRGASRHALGDIDGALDDWSAHLRAYGDGGGSPHAAEIRLLAGGLVTGDLVAGARVPERVS